MNSAQVFGQGIKVAETDKLNIDSIIARLLEGKTTTYAELFMRKAKSFWIFNNFLE